jgi:TonB family protein
MFAWAQTSQVPAPAQENSFGSSCPYPETARTAHIEGSTTLSYRGTSGGYVEDVKVIGPSGHADLDDAAAQCMSRWKINPNDPVDKFNLGNHTIMIVWNIPDAAPGTPPPVGKLTIIGRPHVCMEYYPLAEAKAGIQGTTILRFTITDEGKVRDEAVDQSSGNANLDDTALQCVRHWLYRPAVENGKPLSVPWKASVIWKLEVAKPPPFAEPPRDCVNSYPVKPEDLAGIDGTTEITYDIVEGEARHVYVARSSGSTRLDRAAVECIGTRRFVREFVIVNGKNVDKIPWMKIRERMSWGDALKTEK